MPATTPCLTCGKLSRNGTRCPDRAVAIARSQHVEADGAVADCTTLISKAVDGADDPEQTRSLQILDAFNGSSGVRALTVLAQTLGNMRLTTLRNSYALA